MENKTIKICKDCKYFDKKFFNDPECLHPELSIVSLVEGKVSHEKCKYLRMFDSPGMLGKSICGVDGYYFEPK